VNDFEEGNNDSDIDILKITDAPELHQRKRLAELRGKRDQKRVDETLERLRQAARNDENVIDPMLDCVRADATLYEIRHAMEDVFGAYREPIFF
jgi:methylmalonyl-CoA mutase N-terminal domain/subunit